MKTSKMLGAVALTAALAMGTMPAFAAGETPAAPDTVGDQVRVSNTHATETGNTGNGNTTVYGQSYIEQLNVTIPITMGVAIPANSGGDIIFPTNYTIVNNGGSEVTVDEVEATDQDMFRLQSATLGTPETNLVNITMSAQATSSANNYPAKNISGMEYDSTTKIGTAVPTTLSWRIPGKAKGNASGETLAVSFTGKASYASGQDGSLLMNDIKKVTVLKYTVTAQNETTSA